MNLMSRIKSYKWVILGAMFVAVQSVGSLYGAAMEGSTSSTNKLTFGGDLRLRQESFLIPGADDRHRQRMRLRFGVKAEMDKWMATFRLASGTGEQTSTNQTFSNGWNQKNIYIDQAYVTYKGGDLFKVHAGKQENPFWRLYSSDLIWDGDLNPEGFSEQASYDVNDIVNVFGNFMQAPVNEISTSKKDPWLFGNQIGVRTKLGGGVRWNLAVANYNVTNETQSVLHSTGAFDSTVIQGDNTRVNGQGTRLAGEFNMLHLMTEVGFQALVPMRVQADFVRNVDSKRANGFDTGYQFGLIVGSAKTAGQTEGGVFHKYSEANATLSDFADSDWGNGGTNRKGYIFWLAHAFTDFFTLQTKYFITERTNPFINTSYPYAASTTHRPANINRLQIDAVFKF